MENNFSNLMDIAVKEFNYILDVNLCDKRVEQVTSNIPQIPKDISYEYYMREFGNNVPFTDKTVAKEFIKHIKNVEFSRDFTPQIIELRFENYKDKSKYDWSSIKSIFSEKEDGSVHCYIISRDITAEKENEIEVIRNYQKDPLTGLINRFGYSLLATQSLLDAIQNNKKMAFFFLDIDNYKYVNDIYGHQVGDKVLVDVAEGLLTIFRSEDIVCRYGGDEFLIVLNNLSNLQVIDKIGERICDEIKSIKLPDKSFQLSCSLGISIFPFHSSDLDELVRLADLALYKAKNTGKNKYCIYDSNDVNFEELDETITGTESNSLVNKLLEYVVDQSDIGVLVIDAESYNIVYANNQFYKIFKINKSLAFCDSKCYKFIYDNSGPCPNCGLKAVQKDKVQVSIKGLDYKKQMRMVNFFGKTLYIFYYEKMV